MGRRLDPTAPNEKLATSKARQEEKIFGLWDGERFHYPLFQFEAGGGPRSATHRLIKVLPRDRDGSVGTDAVLWVFTPDDALDGDAPVDVFPTDPERVIELARLRMEGGVG